MMFYVVDVSHLQPEHPVVPQNPTFTLSSTSQNRCRPPRGRPPTTQMFHCTAAARTVPPQRGGAPRCRAWASTWAAPWRMTSAASGKGPEESAGRMTSAAPLAQACRSTCLDLTMPWNCAASWPMRSQCRTAGLTWRILMPSESSGSLGASSLPCLLDSLSASIWSVWVDHRLYVLFVVLFVVYRCDWIPALSFQSIFAPFLTLELGYMGLSKYFPKVSSLLPFYISFSFVVATGFLLRLLSDLSDHTRIWLTSFCVCLSVQ